MDIEQTMRLILDMQAKHEAWLQVHEEAVRKHDEQIRVLLDATLSLVHHGEETDRRISETGRLIREFFEETNRRSQETDYKLNALIETVDKLVKRNGSRE